MENLLTVDALISLLTLALLEIVLGIDNIVVLAILSGKLPKEKQSQARKIGLGLAMFGRIALLTGITWVMHMTKPVCSLPFIGPISVKDIIMLVGGLFLIVKSTHEIHERLEGEDEVPHADEEAQKAPKRTVSETGIIVQIVALDLIFSLDSVITAVGIADQLAIMIAAVILAVSIMMLFSDAVSDFVNSHPSVKMLAMSFLILIGVLLVADGTHHEVPKGYAYFAMAFSLCVEILNIRASKARASKPVVLRNPHLKEEEKIKALEVRVAGKE